MKHFAELYYRGKSLWDYSDREKHCLTLPQAISVLEAWDLQEFVTKNWDIPLAPEGNLALCRRVAVSEDLDVLQCLADVTAPNDVQLCWITSTFVTLPGGGLRF